MPGMLDVPQNRQCNTSDRWAKRGQRKDRSLRVTCQAGTKKKGGGRVIFSPQVCAGRMSHLRAERCTCGTKRREKILRTDRQMSRQLCGQPCCDSSRICDLQQIAFVSPHKLSPLLRIDGESSYLFQWARQASVATKLCL